LEKLKVALQDKKNLQTLWPEARMKDFSMFDHINFEFDLTGSKITAETAAKDSYGVPVYQYIYDVKEKEKIEIVKIDDLDINTTIVDAP